MQNIIAAIFENEKTLVFEPSMLTKYENKFNDPSSEYYEFRDIIASYDISGNSIYIYHDMNKERTLCAKIDAKSDAKTE